MSEKWWVWRLAREKGFALDTESVIVDSNGRRPWYLIESESGTAFLFDTLLGMIGFLHEQGKGTAI